MDSELGGAIEPMDAPEGLVSVKSASKVQKGIISTLLDSAATPLPTDEKRIQLRLNQKTSERQPDLVGICTIDGVRYSVSLWENRTQTGQPILRGSLREDLAKII